MIRANRLSIVSWFTSTAAAVLMSAGAALASVTISSGATKNMSCSGGVCSPTAKKAVLNVSDLTSMLASGDVKVTTGAGAVTITIGAPFSWTSTSRLTLDAKFNVSFRAPVTVAGQGAVTITTNDGGSGGDLLFFPGGKLDFWDLAGKLSINGERYTLVGDIATFAKDVPGNPSGFYALAADYDASADGTYSQAPIPDDFVGGTFEGLGHSISNLDIDSETSHVGFFSGLIGDTVRDFGLTNAQVHAFGDAGILVGTLETESLITNCFSSGSVSGATHAGGLVGLQEAGSIIQRSHSDADVTGELTAGGLVGDMGFTTLTASYATGKVTGASGKVSAGGLVGFAEQSHISDSYATGPVVSGRTGPARAQAEEPHKSPAPDDGGLIGQYSGSLSSSYSTGSITSPKRPPGGLIGSDHETGSIRNTYWDMDTSGVSNPAHGAGNIRNDPGITGLTDAQMKSGLPAGFDPGIWGRSPSINDGYPYLLANPPPQ